MCDEVVYMVQLRRPDKFDPKEMRTDPLWEFGSFGLTGCHHKNLLSTNGHAIIEGARFGFAQGGDEGFKLVFVTPTISVIHHANLNEARWESPLMPFKYVSAPLLIDNGGASDFDFVPGLISNVKRRTWMGKFTSKFKASKTPLSKDNSASIVLGFQKYLYGHRFDLSENYTDALPFPPRVVDTQRMDTYQELLKESEPPLFPTVA